MTVLLIVASYKVTFEPLEGKDKPFTQKSELQTN